MKKQMIGSIAVVAVLGLISQAYAQTAFYTFTSTPDSGHDGFLWDADTNTGIKELGNNNTFFAPAQTGNNDVNNIENFSGNINFFDSNFVAAKAATRFGITDAWWGNPQDGNGQAEIGMSFINTTAGFAETISFDFAWAAQGTAPGALSHTVEIQFSNDLTGQFGFDTFNLTDPFSSVNGGFNGQEGRISIDASQIFDDDNGDPLNEITSFIIDLSPVTQGNISGLGEFAIDNMSIDGGGGAAAGSNLVPTINVENTPVQDGITLSKSTLRSITPGVLDERTSQVTNIGTVDTTYSTSLDTSGGFGDPGQVSNVPIDAGQTRHAVVATLDRNLPSGEYDADLTFINDLNPQDPDNTIVLRTRLHDAPVLTDNSGSTIDPTVDPSLTISNAPVEGHAGALRAGVEVTGTTVTGSLFKITGINVGDTIAAGETLNGSVVIPGLLSGSYNSMITANLIMVGSTGPFLAGAEAVPSIHWNVAFTITDNVSDSESVGNGQNFADAGIGVNNGQTAAVLVGGISSSNQTVTVDFTSNPEAGGGSPSATLAGDAIDLSFGGSSGTVDKFVLQFSYDEANVPAAKTEGDMRILFFDTNNNVWDEAINLNSDGGAGGSFFAGSFEAFLASIGGGDAPLSAFGVDTVNNQLWGVFDHNTIFASGTLIPEPATAALLGLMGLGMLGRRRAA